MDTSNYGFTGAGLLSSCIIACSDPRVKCKFSSRLDAFQGSQRCDSFVQAVWQGTSFSCPEFTDDLRHRLRTAWKNVEGLKPQGTNSKLATYQSLLCSAF